MRQDIEVPEDDSAPPKPYDAEGALGRTLEALAYIDVAQHGSPTCVLCGQCCTTLDRWDLCSKVSDSHTNYRNTHTPVHSLNSQRKVRRG